MHAKGLVTQADGGYLTSLGREAAEYAQTMLGILTAGLPLRWLLRDRRSVGNKLLNSRKRRQELIGAQESDDPYVVDFVPRSVEEDDSGRAEKLEACK